MFQDHFDTFLEFLNEHELGEITPKQYEMTYVNIIPEGEGSTRLLIHRKCFQITWRDIKERFLRTRTQLIGKQVSRFLTLLVVYT